jgi:hypothetical protein
MLAPPPQHGVLAIYAPMIYTAPYVMFLMRADPLRGQVGGGWALEIETFLDPVLLHRAVRREPFGPQKSRMGRRLAAMFRVRGTRRRARHHKCNLPPLSHSR